MRETKNSALQKEPAQLKKQSLLKKDVPLTGEEPKKEVKNRPVQKESAQLPEQNLLRKEVPVPEGTPVKKRVSAHEKKKPEARQASTSVKGPLSGIRILDLTRLYPGPLATMMMGDLGADVIKIEDMIRPDTMRMYPPYIGDYSAGYLALNRAKRSVSIKLNEDRGREIFFRLVKTADVVIEQYRPGMLEKIGIDYTEAIMTNPKVIYISLTGYGQSGPYSQKAGHDVNYLGYSGILGVTGTKESPSVLPGVQIADVAGGAYMAIIATLSALWAREQNGVGQKVDVSMLDGVLPLMTLQLAHYWATSENAPPWQLPLSGGLAAYGNFCCKDGKYVALGALEAKFWKKFCQVAGKPGWEERYYGTMNEQASLKADLTRMFLEKTRDEWVVLFGNADVCLSPVLDISEIAQDAHIRARNMIVHQDHPKTGLIESVGVPLKFSQTKPGKASPPPELGRHTMEILREAGFSEKEIDELADKQIILARND